MSKHFVIEQEIGGRWSEYDSSTDQHQALTTARRLASHGGRVRVVAKARRHNTIPPHLRHEAEEYDREYRKSLDRLGFDADD